MKKKSVLAVLSLFALSLGATACGNTSSVLSSEASFSSETPVVSSEVASVTSISIDNKEAFGDFYVGASNIKLEISANIAINVPNLLHTGDLVITSSNTNAAAILGQYVVAVAEGTSKITVTYKGTLSDSFDITVGHARTAIDIYKTVHAGTEEDPLDNEDAVKVGKAVSESGNPTPSSYYIKGVVDSFVDAPSSYGNVSFYLKPTKEGGEKFEVYRVKKGEKNEAVTDDDIWVGGTAVVYAQITAFKGVSETSGGYLVSCTGEKPTVKTIKATVTEAIAAGQNLADKASSVDTYIITGYIVKVEAKGTFWVSDTKGAVEKSDSATMFEVYGYKGDNVDKLTVNAKIKITTLLKKFKSTIENSGNTVIEILEEGDKAPMTVTGAPALKEVAADTEYVAGALQGNLNKNLFLNGAISDNYLTSVSEYASASKVILKAVDGGYNLQFKDGKYINADTGKATLDKEAKTVWTWDSSFNTVHTTVKDTEYYISASGNYSTFGAYDASKIFNKDGKVNSGYFPLEFYSVADLVAPTEFEFSAKSASVVVGSTLKAPLSANPYNYDVSKLAWSSSDEAVATVANGVVTGVAKGTATITAKLGDVSASFEIRVVMPEMGTAEKPISVSTALKSLATLNLASTTYTSERMYVTGVVTKNADKYGGFYIADPADTTKKIQVYNSVKDKSITADICQNDTVVLNGFVENYNGTLEFTKNGDETVNVTSLTAGTSTVTADEVTGATVTLGATSGTNGSTFTFTVAVEDGYTLSKVTVNGKAVTPTDGVYTGTIAGNTVVSVVVVKAGAVTSVEVTSSADSLKATDDTDYASELGISGDFTAVVNKGNSSNPVGLYTNSIRLYSASSGNGCKITFTLKDSTKTIQSISGFTFDTNSKYSTDLTVLGSDGTTEITATDGVYAINGTSFVLKNGSSKQIRIKSFTISYK
jgi:hypothetical protein